MRKYRVADRSAPLLFGSSSCPPTLAIPRGSHAVSLATVVRVISCRPVDTSSQTQVRRGTIRYQYQSRQWTCRRDDDPDSHFAFLNKSTCISFNCCDFLLGEFPVDFAIASHRTCSVEFLEFLLVRRNPLSCHLGPTQIKAPYHPPIFNTIAKLI